MDMQPNNTKLRCKLPKLEEKKCHLCVNYLNSNQKNLKTRVLDYALIKGLDN